MLEAVRCVPFEAPFQGTSVRDACGSPAALERDCFSLTSSAKFWASARQLILETKEIMLQLSLPASADAPASSERVTFFFLYCITLGNLRS